MGQIVTSVRKAAEMLDIGVDQVYRLIYNRKLVASKNGDKWDISIASIEQRQREVAAIKGRRRNG